MPLNLKLGIILAFCFPLWAGAAPAQKTFRWPNPATDCDQFNDGNISHYSRLAALSKVPGEQLSKSLVPANLVEIPTEVLNPSAIQWSAQAAAKAPADSTLYKYLADRETLAAFLKMEDQARREGLRIYIYSSYRSFNDQCYVYSEKLRDAQSRATSQEEAEQYAQQVYTVSAYPGRSEHQLGTAFDITSESNKFVITKSFESTAEFRWLSENAHLYGFVLSYPPHDGLYNTTTGYVYEPWHWRYIGPQHAKVFKKLQDERGLTLIEYLRFVNKTR